MNMRCCHLCKGIPGACALKWSCACHGDDRRDRHDTLTDWEIAAQQAVRKHLNDEARADAYSKEESARIEFAKAWLK